jgi:hypothetical protein
VQVESTAQDEEDKKSDKQGHSVQSTVQDEEDDLKNQISVVDVGYYLQA